MQPDAEAKFGLNQTWNKHKANSHIVAEHYSGSDFEKYAQRISHCADFLTFQQEGDKLKLLNTYFCRVRHCPICQWRRSLKWKARAFKDLPRLIQDFPKDRWLFLTLTVKNCPLDELKKTLNHMNQSFIRLTRLKAWCVRGWIRSAEVIRGKDGLAHPHFHCLLMVPASYFSGAKYLSHQKWMQLWRQSLRVDYDPIVNIKKLKQADEPLSAVSEVLKYQTKASDLIADAEWLYELTKQLHGTRAIALGGIIATYMQSPEQQDEADEAAQSHETKDPNISYFAWWQQEQRYQGLYS